MSVRNLQCTNLANCHKALGREVIEIEDGEESICPECKGKLTPVGSRNDKKRVYIAAIGIIALACLTIGGYLIFHGKLAARQTAGKTLPSSPPTVSPVMAAYPCGLKPVAGTDVVRLLQYLKQGMNYASQKQADLALHEFEQVLNIDPNFLGARMDIGSARLVMRQYSEAEAAFNGELRLIACLKQMDDAQLAQFAYMHEVQSNQESSKGHKQAVALRSRLDAAEADVHFNLACVKSRQKENKPAMAELEKALAGGLIDKKKLQTDSDLQQIRSTAEFKQLIARYNSAPDDNRVSR